MFMKCSSISYSKNLLNRLEPNKTLDVVACDDPIDQLPVAPEPLDEIYFQSPLLLAALTLPGLNSPEYMFNPVQVINICG